jgi:hypothetical protein
MTKEEVNPHEVSSILAQYGLNWEVKKEPLVIEVEKRESTASWLLGSKSTVEETPFWATVRQDNRVHFAAVAARYEVFQNHELIELALRVADEIQSSIVNCFIFGMGKHIMIQIDLGSSEVGGYYVESILTLANAHDGAGALKWGFGNRTIGCMNMYWSVYNSLEYSIRHTKNMREMVEQSLEIIQKVQEDDVELISTFRRMAKTYASSDNVRDVIKLVTGVDQYLPYEVAEKDYTTQAIRKSQELLTAIRNESEEKGATLWGLFSGVTYYTTHIGGTENGREKSKVMGDLKSQDNKAFELIKSFVS